LVDRLRKTLLSTALLSATVFTLGSTGRAAVPATRTPAPRKSLEGLHRSVCEKIPLHGRTAYSRLVLRFSGKRYSSSETLYSDPKCEISVLETASQGTWRIERKNVLSLRLSKMQFRPLDPRIVDSLSARRSCGHPDWEYGVSREILGTPCGHGRLAEYFIGIPTSATRKPARSKRLDLYECEGRRRVGPGCTHYSLARVERPRSAKSLKP
jgi:hypothetical protein